MRIYSYCNGLWIIILLMIISPPASAQDPFFSQFYSSPLSVNPALAGNGNSIWRANANSKSQWIDNGIEPISTTSFSVDGKILKQKNDGYNYIGGGLSFIQDRAISGAYKSSSINLIASSYIGLDEDGFQGLSIGIGANYSNTYIDFSSLSFSTQLTSSGFNRILPTNEIILNGIKPYVSAFAGCNLNLGNSKSNWDIGISIYRFVKSVRTTLNDNTQIDPPRLNFHLNFERYLNDHWVLNMNSLFVSEKNIKSFVVGANVGAILNDLEEANLLYGGLWVKDGHYLIPYLGMSIGRFGLGLTYDINLPASNITLNGIRTFELALSYNGSVKKKSGVPCPWK